MTTSQASSPDSDVLTSPVNTDDQPAPFPSDAERTARRDQRAVEISRAYEERTFNWPFSR